MDVNFLKVSDCVICFKDRKPNLTPKQLVIKAVDILNKCMYYTVSVLSPPDPT